MSILNAGTAGGLAAIAMGVLLAAPAQAQTSSQDVMKQCGEKWQSAKAANATGNQTWPEFLSKCRSGSAQAPATQNAPAAAPTVVAQAKPAEKPAPATSKPAPTNAVFPAKIDPKYAKEKPAKQRMQTCLDQYNANKASKANGGLNWIQKGGGYYSECNKRLGGGKPA